MSQADAIQVCGSLIVRLDGERREERLPGRQGRMLVAYLVVNRVRPVIRHELAAAVWPDAAPEGAAGTLATLLSRVRRALGPGRLQGKSDLPGAAAGRLDRPRVEQQRRHVEAIRLRALDAVATLGLALGGAELPSVDRSARALIEAAPFRETGRRASRPRTTISASSRPRRPE